MNNFDMVKEFHAVFCPDQTATKPEIVNPVTWYLRLKLINSELSELIKAHHDNDLVEVADALADLLYVVYGTALAYGIDIDAVFKEVHASNMTKLGKDGTPIRDDDGKVKKGPDFKPPAIAQLLGI